MYVVIINKTGKGSAKDPGPLLFQLSQTVLKARIYARKVKKIFKNQPPFRTKIYIFKLYCLFFKSRAVSPNLEFGGLCGKHHTTMSIQT